MWGDGCVLLRSKAERRRTVQSQGLCAAPGTVFLISDILEGKSRRELPKTRRCVLVDEMEAGAALLVRPKIRLSCKPILPSQVWYRPIYSCISMQVDSENCMSRFRFECGKR